jgi:ribonuclease-3
MSIDVLQQRLGYTFANPALLRQALTHRSHGQHNNERLEFLGDSVLNCVVSALLYDHFGRIDEGDLSRLRANLVKQQSIYEIAQRLELSQNLLLGEGELKSGGFRRPSILGDTFEAIIGAIYLDGGFDAAQRVIGSLYAPILKTVDPRTLGKDAKTLLQEHLQGRKIPLPVYSVVATHGAAHNQLFEVECAIPKLAIQVLGTGGSRRAAEQGAAKLALERAQALMPTGTRRTKARGDKSPDRVSDKPAEPASSSAAVAPRLADAPASNGNGTAPPNGGALSAFDKAPEPISLPADSVAREASALAPSEALPAPERSPERGRQPVRSL